MKNSAIIPLLLLTAALLGTVQAQTEDLIKAVDQLRTLHTSGDHIAENKLAWEVTDGLTLKDIENHFFSGKKNRAIQKLICASEYGEIGDLRPHIYQKFAMRVKKKFRDKFGDTTNYENFQICENPFRIGEHGKLLKKNTLLHKNEDYSFVRFNLFKINKQLQGLDRNFRRGGVFGETRGHRCLLYAHFEKLNNKIKKTWRYKHDLSLEQTLFCMAMQNRYANTFQCKAAFPLAKESSAYNMFCSLDKVIQDNILLLGWVKPPFAKQAEIVTRRYADKTWRTIKMASVIAVAIPAIIIIMPFLIAKEFLLGS